MTVLVLSEDLDLTTDRVVAELTRRGVPVFRADTALFPTRLAVGVTLRGSRWCGTLRTPNREVDLDDLRSAWYRRPTGFSLPEGLSEPERQHAAWEGKLGLGGVLLSLPVLWVNHPSREADAAYKPAGLAAAARAGLAVPDTLVTNDPEAVRRFATECDHELVVKLLGANLIFEEDTAKVVYTRRLGTADLSDLAGVRSTAHLFQRWVDKRYEVRLTAVGGEQFAAAVEATSEAGRVDWRADIAGLRIRPIDVPEPVANGVRRYLAEFGLRFGAFDFIVTPRGEWVFLECNPGGQFGFVEAATGLPITAALADLLERGAL